MATLFNWTLGFFRKKIYNKKDIHKDSKVINEEDENITCPYGEENCDEDDFESMCDGCKEDRGESYNEARMDTYD